MTGNPLLVFSPIPRRQQDLKTKPQSNVGATIERSGLSEAVDRVRLLASHGDVTLGQLAEALDTRSHALLCLVLALPFVQPVPVAGLSSIIGPVIFLAGIFLARGQPPWLPEKWRRLVLPTAVIQKAIAIGEKVDRIAHRWFRRRFEWCVEGRAANIVAGMNIGVSAALLALPLPIPFTNTLPALSILFTAAGLLERDGYWIIGGVAMLVAASGYFAALATAGHALAGWM
ncbi:exopolysaccharide biosynthesis protein [bacterium]|nr:exopolysaccharide biosynthesis protein [bacterium]